MKNIYCLLHFGELHFNLTQFKLNRNLVSALKITTKFSELELDVISASSLKRAIQNKNANLFSVKCLKTALPSFLYFSAAEKLEALVFANIRLG